MSRSQRAIELGSMFYIESGVRSAPARAKRRCAGEHCLTWLARDRSVFDRYCSACEHKLKPPVVHVLEGQEPPETTRRKRGFCDECGERVDGRWAHCKPCSTRLRRVAAEKRLKEQPRPSCVCGKPCEKGGRTGWRKECCTCRRRRRELDAA